MMRIALIGNPNCGKTTLFNALTGDNQRVGNWAGVTVEKKTGTFSVNSHHFQLTDLPGIYSLAIHPELSGLDERIAAAAVVDSEAEVLINVVNACHLERHLYLTSQLLELGKPILVVLTMMDLAKRQGISINTAELSNALQCPVIAMEAYMKVGILDLQRTLSETHAAPPLLSLPYPPAVQTALHAVEKNHSPYYARRLLESAAYASVTLDISEDLDILMADVRYRYLHKLVTQVQAKQTDKQEHITAKLDKIVLHRFWGLPIFFAMMYGMFFFSIHLGGALQTLFDSATETLFVRGSAWLLQQLHSPDWLIALGANGLGKGINTTLTFIPVIASLFFFLALLETSGYMARAAFVVDRAMRFLGLPGKAFVPMIVGFGCNVPAIMAARTLDSEHDRLLTVLMSPFMSCSARLAIYTVFVTAFFPTGGQNIVFSLYCIGIGMAVLTGFMLRKTLLHGPVSPLILELPFYHWPTWKRIGKETYLRLRYFLFRAGKLIIPVCIIIGGLNTLSLLDGMHLTEDGSNSILATLGQWITPFFSPMGIHASNWPATVGLLTGMLAKEVVIGSLNTLYMQMSALPTETLLRATDGTLSQSVYGIMYQQFDGKIGAYAYLLFILLYIPCASTMAVIRQEANSKWMGFSIAWSILIAYTCAVLFYQGATVSLHPLQTFLWFATLLSCVALSISMLWWATRNPGARYALTDS